MFDTLKEECGVFGMFSKENIDIAQYAYYALFALQHRGQESAGIVVNDDGIMNLHKNVGLVNEVFTPEVLSGLGKGNIVIGHVRYGTTGTRPRLNAQPLLINHVKGSMALAHNGNLINDSELREKLELEGSIFHTTSDTEVISYVIVKERLNAVSIEEAVIHAMEKIKGAYSLLIMSPTKLIAVRDPYGFRPLCIGALGDSYVFASESCAFDAIGATFLRDVKPGEVVVVDKNGMRSFENHCNKVKRALCVFEYIYFARPDSVIDGASVHTARLRAGAFLALEHPVQADVVVGVPDSGIDAAIGYARQSGIPYGVGLIKSKYVGRTFIQPSQEQREVGVRLKLSPIVSVLKDKRVILIDDSIVRGTTSARLVKLIRDAGAKEVHMRISAPPFRHPCYFGTDIDSPEHLLAANHSIEEMAKMIGVDSLGFLSIDSVKKLAETGDNGFCTGCFSGTYPLEIPCYNRKSKYERKLSERTEANQ